MRDPNYSRPVLAVRRLLAKRHFIVSMLAVALALKLLIPTGYMIDRVEGRITVTLCSGSAPRTVTMMIPGLHGDMPDHGRDHGGSEIPCAFSGLSAPMLGAIDVIQFAALIAFVVATGFVGIAPPAFAGPASLRPPSRGPPASS